MTMKSRFENVMDHEVDRLEFLRYFAITIAAIAGVFRLLDGLDHGAKQVTSPGYGDGVYGGPQDSPHRTSAASQSHTQPAASGNPPLVHL